ncbi:MAG: AzlD domain-containing protein [Chloroflexi bacterium]|nr:AzlD domain-containing protein [Chloroflexota bacterium]
MNAGSLWILVAAMGLTTYGIRAGSVLLADRLPKSAWIEKSLRFIPISVLSALIALELSSTNGSGSSITASLPRWVAAATALLVGRLTRSLWLTVIVGMLVFLLLQR